MTANIPATACCPFILSNLLSSQVGLRQAMVTGAVCFGSGLAVTAAGGATHSLPLLYTGNLLAGMGYGCAYTPPIQALINWFPDKKGLASGIVIGGFGSGALFFTPAINSLCLKFSSLPTYLGSQVDVVVEGGRQFVAGAGGQLQEVTYIVQQQKPISLLVLQHLTT